MLLKKKKTVIDSTFRQEIDIGYTRVPYDLYELKIILKLRQPGLLRKKRE